MKKIALVVLMALCSVSFGDIVEDCSKGCEQYMEMGCELTAELDENGKEIHRKICKKPDIKAHINCKRKCGIK